MTDAPVADLLMRDALRAGQIVQMRVSSGSMRPALSPGDLLRVDGRTPEIGDVAVAWIDGNWLSHRVVGRGDDGFLLAGDASESAPKHIAREAVVGRVVGVKRKPMTRLRDLAARARSAMLPGSATESARSARAALVCLAVSEAAAHFGAIDAAVRRLQIRAGDAAAGILNGALDRPDLEALTVRLYDLAAPADPGSDHLFPWEEAWYERRLPDPPGRVLVGAAGCGREVKWLVSRGHAVDALEPAPRAAHLSAASVGGHGITVVGTYQQLNRAVLDREPNACRALAERRYDAMILGWGSLSHVLDPIERERLLRSAARLAPAGPILAAFFVRNTQEQPLRQGRAFQLGARFGRLLSGRTELSIHPPSSRIGPWYGLSEPLGREEVSAIAASLGRHAIWDEAPGEFPHATLPPPGTSEPSS